MYEEFFGLTSRPFTTVPHGDEAVASPGSREALDSLIHCISQSRGIAVVTSAAGMGKTSLCKQLAGMLRDQAFSIQLSSSAFPTRRALLQAILFEMNISYVGLSEQEARLQVLDAARKQHADGRVLLLILDEAHLLPTRMFEELRTLADYAPDGIPLIRLVLCGQFELEEKLTDPALSAFNQRIGAQVCLEPLTMDESARFLIHRLQMCGAGEPLELLTESALEAICRASDGNLRCLTQLADHAFLLAFAEESRPVTEAVVRAALDDLKELPLHWNDLPPTAGWEAGDSAATVAVSRSTFDEEDATSATPAWSQDLPSHPDNDPQAQLTPEMEAAERETDEFEIPEHLFSLATDASDIPELPNDPDWGLSAVEHPSPEAVETAEDEVASEIPYAVIEVGSGIETPSAVVDLPEVDMPVPIEQPLSAELPALSQHADEGGIEIAVVDRYALLDRMRELPEERRSEIKLPARESVLERQKYPYLAYSAQSGEQAGFAPASASFSEEEILETVQQIRSEILDAVSRSRELIQRGRAPADEVSAAQTDWDIVQPDSGSAPAAAEEPAQHSSFDLPEEQPRPAGEGRFAQLFTRLRDRRRRIAAQQTAQ